MSKKKPDDTTKPAPTSKQGSFNEKKDLNEQEQANFSYVKERIDELKLVRSDHYGHNLDTMWADADRDYVPHRLNTVGKRVISTDEDKGWRGSRVTLGSNSWQSDISQANPYVKIQTALSLLVDQNPSGVFTPSNRKYRATTEIIRQLYQHSWEYAKSKEQLKLFVYNLSKYGWACARTYPLKIDRTVKVLKEYNEDAPEKSTYEEKEVCEYNDIMRENLDPRNVWIDDMARPNNIFSIRDWCWRKVYSMESFHDEFDKYSLAEKVQPGGNIDETVGNNERGKTKKTTTKNQVEVLFYENRLKDLFMVIANGVPLVIEPLPISDTKGLKKLSLWQTYWTLRHAESPYGIGIYEAIRYDQGSLDRIRNMTIDQLTLSIYKMFFYQGTQSLTETGDIKIAPGVGKQVLDPKNITWLEVPGPGQDAYMGIEMMRKDVDEVSGITDPLLGAVTGKTAFEIAQAKEAALKRLKNPLENILEALNAEGYITISLMQILYSIPEVYEVGDPYLIDDYLKEVQSDPDLYERSPATDKEGNQLVDEDGNPVNKFKAKVYREFPLNLDKDGEGNMIQAPDSQFFRLKPSCLDWEGIINIKSESLLSPSKQIDKALGLEMYNVLIPLMQAVNQERQMRLMSGMPVTLDNLTNGKTIKNILQLYEKDPRDVIPDEWLKEVEPPLFLNPGAQPGVMQPQMGQPQIPQGPVNPNQGAQTLIPSTAPPSNPQSLPSKISAKMSAPLRI